MKILKQIALWISGAFFSLVLAAAFIVLPFTIHLTNRDTVKNWIQESMILDNISDLLPEIMAESFEQDEGGFTEDENVSELLEQSGIDQDVLISSVQEVITPEYLTEKIEPVVDGFYDWLEGKTDRPEFEISISDRVTAVADNVSTVLETELLNLPDCPANMNYEDFNPFTAQCLPGEINASEITQQFKENFTHDEEIADQVFSSDDFDWNEADLVNIPKVFQTIKALPVYFLISLSLFGAVVVLTSKGVKSGFRKVSGLLFWPGLLYSVIYLILRNAGSIATSIADTAKSGGDALSVDIAEKVLQPILDTVVYDIASTGFMLAAIATILGAIIWLSLHTWHKTQHEAKQSEEQTETAPAAASEPAGLPPKNVEDTNPSENEEST